MLRCSSSGSPMMKRKLKGVWKICRRSKRVNFVRLLKLSGSLLTPRSNGGFASKSLQCECSQCSGSDLSELFPAVNSASITGQICPRTSLQGKQLLWAASVQEPGSHPDPPVLQGSDPLIHGCCIYCTCKERSLMNYPSIQKSDTNYTSLSNSLLRLFVV